MTKKEALYRFLSGSTSKGSFRKWLLGIGNKDGFFSEDNFYDLKTLAITFSNPKKIKNIIEHYVDHSIVEQLILNRKFDDLVNRDEDILIKLEQLKTLGKQQQNKLITDFVQSYEAIFQSAPRLTERKNWNEEIFIEKRKEVEKHQKAIMDKILGFSEHYFF